MEEPADVAIVGAGAAGLMAAIFAARGEPVESARHKAKPRVLLFDSRPKIGAKIIMSGGTRCNVTHRRVLPSDYQGGPSHFVKHVLEGFTPSATIEFFKAIGVELVLEETGKYFPVTHSGKTVLEALMKEAERAGVRLVTGVKITAVHRTTSVVGITSAVTGRGPGRFELEARVDGEKKLFYADRVVLCTGGLSHPDTGSDGTGLNIARALGHSVVSTSAALTPLLTDDADWKGLSGLSLDARLSFFAKGKKKAEFAGPFLFTHFGFSGPAALNVSRFFARAAKEDKPEIVASFLPGETEESLGIRLKKIREAYPAKSLKTILTHDAGLPQRFVDAILSKTDVRKVAHALLNCPLRVTGVFGYTKAEATAGGVDLAEVRVSTLESKKVPWLYFAGEILDVDGRIGGFNFQWAWSSGAIAGRSSAASL